MTAETKRLLISIELHLQEYETSLQPTKLKLWERLAIAIVLIFMPNQYYRIQRSGAADGMRLLLEQVVEEEAGL